MRPAWGLRAMRFRILALAAVGAAVVAGCGSSSSSAKDDPVAAATAVANAASTKGPKLKIVSSDYGSILANGRGRALYLFTADHGKTSSCSGDCATAWPPYVVKSKPSAGAGVKGRLIGTTRRRDGRLQ